jgi:predicted enzyme related to lactoylglutathione lyase
VLGRWVTDQAATGTGGLRAYIYVTGLDDSFAAATCGGQVVAPLYPVGTLWVALFADPAGNVLGIWQGTAGNQEQR